MTTLPLIHILGSGIAGLWQALLLAKAGFAVTVYEKEGASVSSWWAGGMLAPDCEAESAEPLIIRLGTESLQLWQDHAADLCQIKGSLVLAQGRDKADFERFARMTAHYQRLTSEEINALEPDLEGRFTQGLFYKREGHVEPRLALPALRQKAQTLGVHFTQGLPLSNALTLDCRGLGARSNLPHLRGVKGETITLETRDITFSRPLRLLHPRFPLYVIPREKNRYLIGATTIESEDESVTLRSAMELMNAAYALHPAFAEAKVVELGCGLRPAFPDHRPHILKEGHILRINGLYRHGFLIAPALARIVRDYLMTGITDSDVMGF